MADVTTADAFFAGLSEPERASSQLPLSHNWRLLEQGRNLARLDREFLYPTVVDTLKKTEVAKDVQKRLKEIDPAYEQQVKDNKLVVSAVDMDTGAKVRVDKKKDDSFYKLFEKHRFAVVLLCMPHFEQFDVLALGVVEWPENYQPGMSAFETINKHGVWQRYLRSRAFKSVKDEMMAAAQEEEEEVAAGIVDQHADMVADGQRQKHQDAREAREACDREAQTSSLVAGQARGKAHRMVTDMVHRNEAQQQNKSNLARVTARTMATTARVGSRGRVPSALKRQHRKPMSRAPVGGGGAPSDVFGPGMFSDDAPFNVTPFNVTPFHGAPFNGAPALRNDAPALLHGAPNNDAPFNDAPFNGAPNNDAPFNDAPFNDAPFIGAPALRNDAPFNDAPALLHGALLHGAPALRNDAPALLHGAPFNDAPALRNDAPFNVTPFNDNDAPHDDNYLIFGLATNELVLDMGMDIDVVA